MFKNIFILFSIFNSAFSLKLNGITKPTNYFDPLGFSNDCSDSQLLWLREAELKHGRWAMISSIAIPSYELVNNEQGIHSLDNSSPLLTSLFITSVAAAEFQTMLNGWKYPFKNTKNIFELKDDYNPGDFNFLIKKDFKNKDEQFMYDAELNHCRLAMIGAAGIISQELVTNLPII